MSIPLAADSGNSACIALAVWMRLLSSHRCVGTAGLNLADSALPHALKSALLTRG